MKFFRAKRGAALVITLIMLGMVTAMAVVFLSISRRERASVSVITDQAGAQLMAETATAQALSKVVSRMVTTQNPLAYGLSVSTNYINREFGGQSTMSLVPSIISLGLVTRPVLALAYCA